MQPLEPSGTIAFNMGQAMSALDCFSIRLKGKGGHGSMPHKSVDAITLSAQVINNMQYIISRQTDPLEPLVLTIGTIKGGFMENVIADQVEMTGTMRSYSQEVRQKALADLERMIQGACMAVGANYEFQNVPAVNPLHHPCFGMDETCLKSGVAAHVALANRFLNTDVTLFYDIR